MTPAASIRSFMEAKKLALVGASRSGRKFGNMVLNELTAKGYTVYPVHPGAQYIADQKCYSSLAELPESVGGVVVVVKPDQSEIVVRDAYAAGIPRVWLQQGAESASALAYCEQNGIDAISRECILMHAEPVQSIHAVHRFFRRLFGRMPK
ncbi:MAG: CoA-binding protein [Spirochaetota bacterium]